MGNCFLYGNGSLDGGGNPVIESTVVTKKYIDIESDTVLNAEADCSNYEIFINSNPVTVTSVAVSDKLKAQCSFDVSLPKGLYSMSIKALSGAFKNKKPNSNVINTDYVIYGELIKTEQLPTPLSTSRYALAATAVGDYALFGGGRQVSSYYSTVDAYDSSLTRTTPTALSTSRYALAATAVGDYALFGGGRQVSSYYSTVDAYGLS